MVISHISGIFKEFFETERSAGIILIITTAIVLLLSQSDFINLHTAFFQSKVLGYSIQVWINDGLMAVFFLLIGLELEREVRDGELSEFTGALLPIFAAVGGMIFPVLVYYTLNHSSAHLSGIAIPTATDIAFVIGILSLFGSRVSPSLKIFLTAVAVADDLGAITIIALFYTAELNIGALGLAVLVYTGLIAMNFLRIHIILPYIIGGVLLWYFLHESGIHATIAGVLLAFAIPYNKTPHGCTSHKLQHHLHKPVAFIVLPLFAMANTAIVINLDSVSLLLTPLAMGIIAGLVIGKPLGITLFVALGLKLNLFRLPNGICMGILLAAGCLCGIGFTMSLFISILALTTDQDIATAKLAVVLASMLSATFGTVLLAKFTSNKKYS